MPVQIPTMEEMLKGGVHFGHQSSRWHPKMRPYIYTVRNGVHIFDLKKTASHLQEACRFLEQVVADGGDVLFVGTKTQAQPLIEKYAKEAGMPYMQSRWIGGLLTNFGEVKKVIQHYLDLIQGRDSGDWKKYTKKEQVGLAKELEKLESTVAGLANLKELPKAVFIVDTRNEKTALTEASVRGISVVGVCDTNVNPSMVDYVIPANDDATRGVELMIKTVADACAEGLKNRKVIPVKTPVTKIAGKTAKKGDGKTLKEVVEEKTAEVNKAEAKPAEEKTAEVKPVEEKTVEEKPTEEKKEVEQTPEKSE